jgi:hypothetical protein
MTTLNVPDLRWAFRQGRRATDPPIPDTRQTFEIADMFRQLVMGDDPHATPSDADRKALAEILRWMPRGDDIQLVLGFFPDNTAPEA